jgi:hypothetical protein
VAASDALICVSTDSHDNTVIEHRRDRLEPLLTPLRGGIAECVGPARHRLTDSGAIYDNEAPSVIRSSGARTTNASAIVDGSREHWQRGPPCTPRCVRLDLNSGAYFVPAERPLAILASMTVNW